MFYLPFILLLGLQLVSDPPLQPQSHSRWKVVKAEQEHCVGGTRVQRWEASGGTAPVTDRRRQKSAGRPADHGSLTTCKQALGGRDTGEEDRESERTGRGRQEGRSRWSWLDLLLRSRRLFQESRWPRRPAPVAGHREVLTVCCWLGASPPILTSALACDCRLPRGSCPRCAPSHRGYFL